jgi:hypothetical protein
MELHVELHGDMHKHAIGFFLARSDKGISLENDVKTEVKTKPGRVSGKTQ